MRVEVAAQAQTEDVQFFDEKRIYVCNFRIINLV